MEIGWLFMLARITNNTESLKKNAGIIKTYHSKTVKHIRMVQVLKCSERHKFWICSVGG
jgi:hypothetical protein